MSGDECAQRPAYRTDSAHMRGNAIAPRKRFEAQSPTGHECVRRNPLHRAVGVSVRKDGGADGNPIEIIQPAQQTIVGLSFDMDLAIYDTERNSEVQQQAGAG